MERSAPARHFVRKARGVREKGMSSTLRAVTARAVLASPLDPPLRLASFLYFHLGLFYLGRPGRQEGPSSRNHFYGF